MKNTYRKGTKKIVQKKQGPRIFLKFCQISNKDGGANSLISTKFNTRNA